MTAATLVDAFLPTNDDDGTSVASDEAETLQMQPRSSCIHVEDESPSTTSNEQAWVFCNMEFLQNACSQDKRLQSIGDDTRHATTRPAMG